MSSRPPGDVTVIGAGIVGVCCALRLQLEGHRVTVIDPRPPGTATSFGNAGIIGTGAITPYSVPGLWRRVPAMLIDPLSALRLRWRYLHRAAPWLVRFLAVGRRECVERSAAEMTPLVTAADRGHRDLMAAGGVDAELLRPVGPLYVFRRPQEARERMALQIELLERHGIGFDVLDGDDVYALEPGLAPGFRSGFYYREESFITEPLALTRGYAEAFRARGGRFIEESVRRFELTSQGPRVVVTDRGMHPVERLVLAAGAWSGELARLLGANVPLDTERGYHLNVPWNDRIVLRRPVIVADHDYVLCPMRDGIRITSGVEFGGLKLPPDFRRIHRVLADARASLTGLDGEVNREWMGFRPSLPDSKPVISRSPRFANVFFAFGHGHLGLTLSAVTARAISDLVAGRESDIPLQPFRADRFRGLAPRPPMSAHPAVREHR